MTTVTDAAVQGAVGQVASAAGLAVDTDVVATGLEAVAGPLLAIEVADDVGPAAAVAVVDTLGDDAETLLAALAETIGASGAPRPVASGADLQARFDRPVDAVALVSGGDVVAVVATAVERRGEDGPAPGHHATLPGSEAALAGGFDKLINVALEVSVELGRTRVTLAEVLDYDVGSVVELDRAAGAPVDVRVNGTLLAQGEVVLIDDEYAVRITNILDPGAAG